MCCLDGLAGNRNLWIVSSVHTKILQNSRFTTKKLIMTFTVFGATVVSFFWVNIYLPEQSSNLFQNGNFAPPSP